MARIRLRFALVALIATLLAAGAAPAARAGDPPADPAATAAAEAKKRLADLVERLKSADLATKKQALADAKAEQDGAVLWGVKRLLVDADADVRLAAIDALAARTDAAAKKQAAEALAPRIAALSVKGASRVELLKVVGALHELAQVASIRALLDGLPLEDDLEQMAARLRAVANVPAAEAIDALIVFASRGHRGREGWQRLTRDALIYATGASVAGEADAWRAWWKEHEKDFDFQAAAERRKREGGGPGTKAEKKKEK